MQVIDPRICICNNKKTCFAGFGGTRIYSRFCYDHTCPKILRVEDGFHCSVARTKDGQHYCDNLMKRCSNSFCAVRTCNFGSCSSQAVVNKRCPEHTKCGISSCDEPCKPLPNGRLYNLCERHLQLKCAKPGCGGRKMHSYRRYCLDHGCRIEKCGNERDKTGGALCEVHRCTANDCYNPIAEPDNYRSLFCTTHACREPDCLYSMRRPSSFCDKHTCKRVDCIKRTTNGPDSLCDAHRDGPCKVEGCKNSAVGNDVYCKEKHGCIEKGCPKARLNLRMGGSEEGEEDLVRCLLHDREWQEKQWKEKYDRLFVDYEKLRLRQRRNMQPSVEDDTEDDSGSLNGLPA